MKQRIIVAVIAIPLLVLAIFFAPVWVLGVLVGAIAAIAAWELMSCAFSDLKLRLKIYPMASAFALALGSSIFDPGKVCVFVAFAIFAVMFCEVMASFGKDEILTFEAAAIGVFAGAVLPLLLSSLVRLGRMEMGAVLALLPFVAAFSSDSGAYFAGLFLGRHSLAPALSPKKTIEGSIGGFVAAIGIMLAYGFVLRQVGFVVNFVVLGVYGFFGSLACQLGDLSFSAIKRQYKIKDFGNLIPGHGGMLDRFDSMFWTAVTIEILVNLAPAIEKIPA